MSDGLGKIRFKFPIKISTKGGLKVGVQSPVQVDKGTKPLQIVSGIAKAIASPVTAPIKVVNKALDKAQDQKPSDPFLGMCWTTMNSWYADFARSAVSTERTFVLAKGRAATASELAQMRKITNRTPAEHYKYLRSKRDRKNEKVSSTCDNATNDLFMADVRRRESEIVSMLSKEAASKPVTKNQAQATAASQIERYVAPQVVIDAVSSTPARFAISVAVVGVAALVAYRIVRNS
jgi:hypothetical protein